MYTRILVPLEHTRTDDCILRHVQSLALLCSARVLLMHVADGWVARNFKELDLRESEEIRRDREYVERCAETLRSAGIDAEAILAGGDPAKEICAAATREGCDLIAMGTHGHRLLADIVYGSVANEVRHLASIPVLLVRDPKGPVS
jgi:nucleotide-binding universal stress UspA family protein